MIKETEKRLRNPRLVKVRDHLIYTLNKKWGLAYDEIALIFRLPPSYICYILKKVASQKQQTK